MNAAIGLEVNTPLRLEFAKGLSMQVLRRPEGFWFVATEVAASMKLEVGDLQQAQGEPLGQAFRLADEAEPVLCLSEGELDEVFRRIKKPGARRLRRWWLEETRPALLHQAGAAGTAETLHLALALAAEAAQQVSRAVLDTVLREPGPWLHSRWVLTLDYAPNNQQRWPHGRLIGLNSSVSTLNGMAELIAPPGKIPATKAELVKLATACQLRLAERIGS
ncbi:prophage antirepressor-like protein [Chromobacterium alkanivorans]|uniref:hypothetical protein n=1 Tax=Chromobacterium alkanivorans TaxID=1071719 RepID=UPI0021681603|nr:hypothetical protein [Chromobacterium alkanivorans]MCS3803750.1 prophage antirepressor-like protein [Chromobacterium alkanivorans]MCS3818145.1 prophage antirepressor-like protein [Chromobacterium alkanivorans]MCS3874656.1 prophage antirepressor-like protein [Chromobacterium alkanivorans]